MKTKVESYVGKKINKLTVIEEFRDKRNFIFYRCKCECGNETTVYRSNLISEKVKSCGCNYKISAQRLKKTNIYTIDYKNNIVIGKTTNTNKDFLIDLDDYELIKNLSWYESSNGYIHHKDREKRVIQLHRFITKCPNNKVVDHINHNIKDNRKQNLKICSQKENVYNKTIKPRNQLNEFCITTNKQNKNIYYIVSIGKKYRGCFKNLVDAKKCRDKYLKEIYKNY